MAEKFTTSEVVTILTAERDCPFISSSSDSEVANGSTEEFDTGKKVRVWSSYITII